jgi:heme a synthase
VRFGRVAPRHDAGRRNSSDSLPSWGEAGLNKLALPFNRAYHRYAIVLACATLLLIVAGALVTSNDAGLSVPDWPTSFGSYIKMPHMVGGVKYEHGHRMVAELVGLLTIGLVFWTWRVERRPWMRQLSVLALLGVIIQGVLGGITVILRLPAYVSSAHAAVAQTFFCVVVLMVVFTGERWIQEHPRVALDTRRPSLISLALLSVFALYVQLFLGAMFRHKGLSWWPHVLNAAVVAAILTWTAVRALSQYGDLDEVRFPAVTVLSLMVTQLCLGFAAFITRVMWGRDAVQPEFPMVISTVAHVVVGALLLATAVVLAVQVWRHVPVAIAEPVPTPQPRPAAA